LIAILVQVRWKKSKEKRIRKKTIRIGVAAIAERKKNAIKSILPDLTIQKTPEKKMDIGRG